MTRGSVERSIRRYVKSRGELGGVQPSLAETAYTLARTLDEGAGLATAAVARELRATLQALEARSDSDLGTAFVAGLFSPVGDEADRAVESGRRGCGDRPGAGDAPDDLAASRRRRRVGGQPGD